MVYFHVIYYISQFAREQWFQKKNHLGEQREKQACWLYEMPLGTTFLI